MVWGVSIALLFDELFPFALGQVARLNADVYSEPVMDLNLKGFPSLVLFQGTKPILNYTGPRDIDALLGVVEASYGQAP